MIGHHHINFTSSAQKQLKSIPVAYQKLIISKILKLSNNPRPPGCKKLTGREGYRIRIGNYRVIYIINDTQLIILIVNIDHRKQVYK